MFLNSASMSASPCLPTSLRPRLYGSFRPSIDGEPPLALARMRTLSANSFAKALGFRSDHIERADGIIPCLVEGLAIRRAALFDILAGVPPKRLRIPALELPVGMPGARSPGAFASWRPAASRDAPLTPAALTLSPVMAALPTPKVTTPMAAMATSPQD